MSTDEPAKPKLRKDAQRNVEKLTAAAIELFSERGLDCPLDEIARRAGVSHGTLYSRFGTREALIDAVVPQLAADQLEAAIQHAEAGTDPWDRFARYVEKISALMAGDPALSDAVTRRYADTPRLSAVCEESFDRGREYVRAAHDVGVLRPDFAPEDFLLLFSASAALARTTEHTAPEAWRRGLAFTLDGLRAAAAHPLPVGPLSPEQALAAMHRGASPSRV
ncbi:TetR/AcrR family transcriptional regulator [Kribbella sp. DT2]|uniref:TetR/AcrR family transcriptional regulator n=1 Tax=Kribbella sp. DT2 TaxID=3393427 RepID=UPI003CE9971A